MHCNPSIDEFIHQPILSYNKFFYCSKMHLSILKQEVNLYRTFQLICNVSHMIDPRMIVVEGMTMVSLSFCIMTSKHYAKQ
jgi:hypothetical protein